MKNRMIMQEGDVELGDEMTPDLVQHGQEFEKLVFLAKSRSASYFVEFAKIVPMTQEQWDGFWKLVRKETTPELTQQEKDMASMDRDIQLYKLEINQLKKQLHEKEHHIECFILGKDWMLTDEEFEFVNQLLGSPVEELSNCCDVEMLEPVRNHSGRCPECFEGCGVVYVWN